jgi:hypothetical protein
VLVSECVCIRSWRKYLSDTRASTVVYDEFLLSKASIFLGNGQRIDVHGHGHGHGVFILATSSKGK